MVFFPVPVVLCTHLTLTHTGKVGGMKDDVCIAVQLAVYYSNMPHMYA